MFGRFISINKAMIKLHKNVHFCEEIDWSMMGITRASYVLHLLIEGCNLYGYATLDGKVYVKKIEKIPWADIPGRIRRCAWGDDYRTILDSLGIPNWGWISVKKSELRKYINELKELKMFIPDKDDEMESI